MGSFWFGLMCLGVALAAWWWRLELRSQQHAVWYPVVVVVPVVVVMPMPAAPEWWQQPQPQIEECPTATHSDWLAWSEEILRRCPNDDTVHGMRSDTRCL